MNFLNNYESIPWDLKGDTRIKSKKVFIGKGNSALEILMTESNSFPTKNELIMGWKGRKGRRANPLLLVNIYNNEATICGISGDNPSIYRNLDINQIERICKVALNKSDRHSAYRFLKDRIDKLDSDLMGIINRGLLSTHELKTGVPDRHDWEVAKNKGFSLLNNEGKELMRGLGFELEEVSRSTYILKDNNKNTAIAVFLEEGISFEQAQEGFNSKSPVNWALKRADENRLPYVIANSGKTIRLYSTDPESGFGSRGRSDTYIEANLDLLTEENCGYLWLIFSSSALRDEGTLHEIMEDSKNYATGLGERLKERIYDEVVPELAEGIAKARNLKKPNKKELDTTYRMALLVLFRLLFIAYGEDERFLPYGKNSRYTNHSLNEKIHSLEEIIKENIDFDSKSTSHWDEINRLVDEIHNGNEEWGLPKYNGRLLSSDPEVSPAGAIISQLKLTNDCFGPILVNLLIDETDDGYKGAIDFRNLGVREFGVIYEGLLESELSVADRDLTVDEDNKYIPARNEDEVLVQKDEIYLHGVSGERKATGTYYTKSIFVDYILDNSLVPALKEHLNTLDNLNDREAEDVFFDFRVADIAMGSGHFLIGAIDKIEKEFSKYLTERNLPEVEKELDRLKEASTKAFSNKELAPEIDDSQLLRRQIARRCIYGVDLNETAVDLARLSIWVHTFVPGLPLTFLNHNLVTGDSLSGIGTLKEAADLIKEKKQNLFSMISNNQEHIERIKYKVEKLGKLADTDAKEVSLSRQIQKDLEEDTMYYRILFDILSVSRIVDNIDPTSLFNKIDDINKIKELREYKIAKKELENINPLHFPLEFPEVFQKGNEKEGFDVIIGNPPWEEATLEIDKFWMRFKPGLQSKSQREKEQIIKKLKVDRPDLVEVYKKELKEQELRREILVKGPYEGMGEGDPDTYKAFYWRFWELVDKKGYIGVVLPRSVFMAAGSEKFRRKILNESIIKDITFLLNKGKWVFDIHPQYTIALLCLQKKKPSLSAYLPLKGPYPNLELFNKRKNKFPYKFPIEQAKNWTKTASFPVLPAVPDSVEIFKKMSKYPPIDYNKPNEWRLRPNTELHATNDKKKKNGTILMNFLKEPPKHFWPVFKGASFNIWTPDTGIRYAWADPDIMLDYLQQKRENSYKFSGIRSAFYEMDEKWIYDKNTLPCFKPRIVFRDITNRTNRRTVIVSLVPSQVFLTNTAPYFIWPRGDEEDQAYLLGVMSSIPFDWYARRFVEEHLNYHLINAFPIPRPGKNTKLRNRVVQLSGRLAAKNDKFKDWAFAIGVDYGTLSETKKQKYIYELDALVALLYNLSKFDLKVIFETFHHGWDYKQRLDKVLDYYKRWEERL